VSEQNTSVFSDQQLEQMRQLMLGLLPEAKADELVKQAEDLEEEAKQLRIQADVILGKKQPDSVPNQVEPFSVASKGLLEELKGANDNKRKNRVEMEKNLLNLADLLISLRRSTL